MDSRLVCSYEAESGMTCLHKGLHMPLLRLVLDLLVRGGVQVDDVLRLGAAAQPAVFVQRAYAVADGQRKLRQFMQELGLGGLASPLPPLPAEKDLAVAMCNTLQQVSMFLARLAGSGSTSATVAECSIGLLAYKIMVEQLGYPTRRATSQQAAQMKQLKQLLRGRVSKLGEGYAADFVQQLPPELR
jgi:hypothetical protein